MACLVRVWRGDDVWRQRLARSLNADTHEIV